MHGQESGRGSAKMIHHRRKPSERCVWQVVALFSPMCPCPVTSGVDKRLALDNNMYAEVTPATYEQHLPASPWATTPSPLMTLQSHCSSSLVPVRRRHGAASPWSCCVTNTSLLSSTTKSPGSLVSSRAWAGWLWCVHLFRHTGLINYLITMTAWKSTNQQKCQLEAPTVPRIIL